MIDNIIRSPLMSFRSTPPSTDGDTAISRTLMIEAVTD